MGVKFQQATLDNGLTIVAEVDDAAHSAAVGYFIKAGARDEATSLMGVSHFLEHMMFKGTATRTADDINRAFDRLGAKNNAYTTSELTCFYATVLPEHLLSHEGVNSVLADMLRPALRDADFQTEKKVILEEIAMYRDNPFFVLYERVIEVHFGAPAEPGDRIDGMHPLGHRVLGTPLSIGDLSRDQMQDYFDRRYSADNTVVSIAGKVDFAQAVDEIGRHCGSWKRTGVSRVPGSPPHREASFEIRDPKVTRAYALMLTPMPGAADDRRYAASLLAQILGGSDNSRLHWALIETGLAEDAECAFDPRDGAGDMLMYVSSDPDRLDEVCAIAEREAARLVDTLCEDDLEKIRCKTATAVTLAGERPGGRMQRLGRLWTYLGRYSTLEEELERINRVTVNDLRSLLKDFPLRPRTVGRMLPA